MRGRFASIGAALLLSACGAGRDFRPSGFLGDEELAFELSDQGNLVYLPSETDLSRYDRILLDDVEVWLDEETRHRGVSWVELRRFAELFEASVRRALEDGYPIVDEPGPGTLRIRIALTEVRPRVDGYSTRENLGYGDPLTVDRVSLHGTRLGMERVSVEIEFRDSVTNARLAAALAQRTSDAGDDETSWEAIARIFDDWAQGVRAALDTAHGRIKRTS